MEEIPLKMEEKGQSRDENGRFIPGSKGGPGRPKGKSLKEYDRAKFAFMSDEEKENFLSSLSPEIRYRMAEGNPHNTTDVTSGDKPIPLFTGYVRDNNSNKEDTGNEEESQGDSGGNVSE